MPAAHPRLLRICAPSVTKVRGQKSLNHEDKEFHRGISKSSVILRAPCGEWVRLKHNNVYCPGLNVSVSSVCTDTGRPFMT